MLWTSVLVILACGLANARKARIWDTLASTICGSMKAYSSTQKVVGLLKIPNQFSENSENCKICRAVSWNVCKSNDCQKFNYVPCTNQDPSSDSTGKSVGKSTRIINGRDLYPHELPFLARIEYYGRHTCGCSIYNENWIITAAHCVVPIHSNTTILKDYSIIGGDHNRSIVDPTEQRVQVKSIVAHKRFDWSQAWQFDIALVQVSPPFKFNSALAPICLESRADEVPVGQQVRVSGWGSTNPKNPPQQMPIVPDIPKTVQIKVISTDECRKTYSEVVNMTQMNICALPESSTNAGGCVGDSGGPLIMDKDGSRFLVGLVSGGGGPECSAPDAPSVYSSIAHYHDWIVANAVVVD